MAFGVRLSGLMKAPDYDPEHDLVVVAPDGTYAACCIV